MVKRKGFTLIELLVVVLIIGILAAIAFPQYQVAVLKTRYTQLMVMADAIRQAQDAYYLATGKYSLKINDLDITVPADCRVSESGGTVTCSKFYCVVNDGWAYADSLGTVYCYMGSSGNMMAYSIFWLRANTQRICRASLGYEYGEKVCKSFGGRLRPSGSDEVWVRYDL